MSDYTSNSLENRRVHKEGYGTLNGSEATNISHHAEGGYVVYPHSDDLEPFNRVRPTFSDEHVWVADGFGIFIGCDNNIAIPNKTNNAGDIVPDIGGGASANWVHFPSDNGWTAVGSPQSAIFSGVGDSDAGSIHSNGTTNGLIIVPSAATSSGVGQGMETDTFGYTASKIYTLKVRARFHIHIKEFQVNVVKNSGSGNVYTKTFAVPGYNTGQDYYTFITKFRTDASSGTSAKIQLLMTANSNAGQKGFYIDNIGIYQIDTRADAWDTESAGLHNADNLIGRYFLMKPYSGKALAEPWKHPPSKKDLWVDKTFMVQAADFEALNLSLGPNIDFEIGAVPWQFGDWVNEDGKTNDLGSGKDYIPWEGWTGYTLNPSSEAWVIWDVAWVLKKGGFSEVQVMTHSVNFSLYQYDDVPGGVQTNSATGTGRFFEPFKYSTDANNILSWVGGPGDIFHGRFKTIKLSDQTNATNTGGLFITAAPERK